MCSNYLRRAMLLVLIGLAGSAAHAGVSVTDHEQAVNEGCWAQAFEAAIEAATPGHIVHVPAGDYRFDQPISITRSVTMRIDAGANLTASDSHLFELVEAEQVNITGKGGWPRLSSGQHVFNLETIASEAEPTLSLRRLRMEGRQCLAGYHNDAKGGLAELEVIDCRLEASDRHIAFRYGRIGSLLVRDSRFTSEPGTSYSAIMIRSPMPGGARVQNNHMEGIQVRAIWLAGGTPSRIQEMPGQLPSVHVENNTLIGSPNKAELVARYVNGIMILGEQVIIQGNVIRDFNRGEPMAAEAIGQHIPIGGGEYVTGRWNYEDDRRLGGAAIYIKARNSVITENIAVNSGWRAVLEIKGDADHNLVANNVLDGRSLSARGSFGIETQGRASLFTGNILANMPHKAMKLQYEKNNTITNNVFHNAELGIHGIYDGDFSGEVLAHNRFINIDEPISGYARQSGARQYEPATLTVFDPDQLPEPGPELRGRIAVVYGDESDRILICIQEEGRFRWRHVLTD